MDPVYDVVELAEQSTETVYSDGEAHETHGAASKAESERRNSHHSLVLRRPRSESSNSSQEDLTRSLRAHLIYLGILCYQTLQPGQQWKRQSRFYGWQWGVLTGTCVGTFVFVMNCVFAIVGATVGSGYQGGIATLFTDSATSISQTITRLHILVNVLSTLLLSASNYAMQVLSSPTWSECKAAHQRGQWLDVGIPSLRNIRHINTTRKILWLTLGLSSIPLHLFYNASIFQVITYNDYRIQFIASASAEWVVINNTQGIAKLPLVEIRSIYRNEVSGYGDVFPVVDEVILEYPISTFQSIQSGNMTLPYFPLPLNVTPDIGQHAPWTDIIVDEKRVSIALLTKHYDTSFISPTGGSAFFRIEEGFAQTGVKTSKIQMSLPFLLIVIICNAVKVSCFLFMILGKPEESSLPLVTIGDAVASFLQHPDDATKGYCGYSKAEHFWKLGRMKRTPAREEYGRAAKMDRRFEGVWEERTSNYGSSISKRKRVALTIIGFAFPLTITIFYMMGRISLSFWGTASSLRLSFGQQKFDESSTTRLAFIANSPQLALSLRDEEITLRVTKPQGKQRETYFLQLPLRFGIPLNALSGVLHWLASQTLFLARIDRMGRDNHLRTEASEVACGFSSSALLALIGVLIALFVIVTSLGFMSFESHVPFAGSCSWVISAACHPDPEEVDLTLEKVM